jgi:fructose-1,6-bisphosphatase/inositol monophosphatase family enzyme
MNPSAWAASDSHCPDKEIGALRDTAIQAAFRAGEIQMQNFRDPNVVRTEALYDVKLETDQLCEQAIVQIIRRCFPDHGILAEEGGRQEGTGECTWIIDPLDGTVNFWHGLPFFCTSIACYAKSSPRGPGQGTTGNSRLGTPLVGVVRLPATDELFVATAGKGATLNGHPIRVDADRGLKEVLVSVSFGKTPQAMQRMTATLADLLPRVRKVRCLGAAAAELAYVAAGYLGGVMYTGLKPWDFAAGKIILEEAGGWFKAVEAQPDQWQVEAGGPGLVGALHSPACQTASAQRTSI